MRSWLLGVTWWIRERETPSVVLLSTGLQQQAHRSHTAGVSDSAGLQTTVRGALYQVRGQGICCKSVCESCSWGALGQRNGSLEHVQSPTVPKKSLARQVRCDGTRTVDVLPGESACTGSKEPLVTREVSCASWLKLLCCCWPSYFSSDS